MTGLLEPVRSRLVETLAGRSDEIPRWVLALEDGDDEGFFGPDSAAWVVHGGMPTLVAGVRALLLQALHPGALAGVREHSRYREDPLGRLAGTIQWIHTVTYGSTGAAVAGTRMVQAMHRRVVGTYVDGHGVTRPYSAADPDLASWVHLTFTDAFLTCHERWGRPIPGGPDGYVREWAKAGELMGVADPPRTASELRDAAGRRHGCGRAARRPGRVGDRRVHPASATAPHAASLLPHPVPGGRVDAGRPAPGDARLPEAVHRRPSFPSTAATAAVLKGAGVLLGPKTQAELAARRRLRRLASERPAG